MRLNVSSIVDKLTNLRNCELYSLFYFFLSLDQNINCYVTLYYIKSKIIRDVKIVGNLVSIKSLEYFLKYSDQQLNVATFNLNDYNHTRLKLAMWWKMGHDH